MCVCVTWLTWYRRWSGWGGDWGGTWWTTFTRTAAQADVIYSDVISSACSLPGLKDYLTTRRFQSNRHAYSCAGKNNYNSVCNLKHLNVFSSDNSVYDVCDRYVCTEGVCVFCSILSRWWYPTAVLLASPSALGSTVGGQQKKITFGQPLVHI